jgi:hypothetical protein
VRWVGAPQEGQKLAFSGMITPHREQAILARSCEGVPQSTEWQHIRN